MTSEIRVNKITNRAGLSTVEYTDTGIVVSGIITATEISGLSALSIAGVGTASALDINGDIDIDGHTNLDNVNIAGVTTFGGSVNYPVGAVANFFDDVNFKGPSGRDIVFDKSHAELHFSDDTTIIMGTNDDLFITHDGTNPSILTKFGTLDIKTSQVAISTNMTVGGILTATTFKGDGSQLTGLAADKIFENNTKVEVVDSGTGYITAEVDGTEALRIKENGYFGLGTNSPVQDLHIRRDNAALRIETPSGSTLQASTGGISANFGTISNSIFILS